MEAQISEVGGCRQRATKNTIKTAKINFNEKQSSVEATRHSSSSSSTIINSRGGDNEPSNSVWPINVKKNSNNKTKQLWLLMTMTVLLMTILQMPNATTAAAVLRVKEVLRRDHHQHHQQDHSGGSSESDSADIESDSDNDIDDILEIVMRRHGHHMPHTRKLKRHSGDKLYLERHQVESDTDLEWANPCGGIFNPTKESNAIKPPTSYYLSQLRKVASNEFHNINYTMNAINISREAMSEWSMWSKYYSFLPRIKLNSNIALKRWYRQTQTYVASFARLGRTQMKWDQSQQKSRSEETLELNQLILSARNLLCEIETTINGSHPHPNNQPKLTSITREAMNKKLNFQTKVEINEAKLMLDLKFAKSKYYHYLRRMWRVIRQRQRQRKFELGLSNDESSASDSKSATIEDFISKELQNVGSKSSRSSSSAGESIEYSNESSSKQQRRRSRQHRRQRKLSHKSAELPRF